MIKTFIGIKIIPTTMLFDYYSEIKNNLKSQKISWVEPNNFHITLKYLGNTNNDQFLKLDKILQNISKYHCANSINIEGFGVFPNIKNPKVLWFGAKKTKFIHDLFIDIEENLELLNFKKENRKYTPHLTIGRIKKISDIEIIKNYIELFKKKQIQKTEIKSFILYQSLLENNKRLYKPLNEYFLK